MKFEIELISKIIFNLVIFLVVIIFYKAILDFQESNDNSTEQILSTINRALVQCYALEGQFPKDVYYLEKYGVIFNTDKYLYDYEPFGNTIPVVRIINLKTIGGNH